MLASERFFHDFGDPLLLESGEELMWSTEFYGGGGGGGGGTAGVSYGGVSFQFSLPSGATPGQPDVRETLTQIADAAERALQQNLGAWQQRQVSAGDAIDRAWRILDDAVARMMQFGAQGQLSAAERDRRIDPARLRWDWIAYYIDPIYLDSTGAPAPAGAGSAPAVSQAGLGLSGGDNSIIWIAAAVLVGLVLMRRRR